MTSYKQGEVLLVPFPFTDLTQTKQRPAVVVSANWFNACRDDAVCVAITSQVPSHLEPDQFEIPAQDLTGAGLLKPSIAKVGKIFAIHETIVVKKIGQLTPDTTKKLIRVLQAVLS